THDGVVTLTGTVETYIERLRAGADAKKVKGVTGVDNEIRVGPVGRAIADAELTAACRHALDADQFVPRGAVSVTVIDGVVTLRGTARNHFQRVAAEHAVGRALGGAGAPNAVPMPN